jgi:hypothetical protein
MAGTQGPPVWLPGDGGVGFEPDASVRFRTMYCGLPPVQIAAVWLPRIWAHSTLAAAAGYSNP